MNRFSLAMALSALACGAGATPVKTPGAGSSADAARRYFVEDPDAPRTAPKDYDVTIVEYLDYQCPVCRGMRVPLRQLLARDRKIRVIYRDWPIFGAQSEAAARIAIASNYQHKYGGVHDALMVAPRPLTDAAIEQAARSAGVSWPRLQRDLKAHAGDIDDLLARNEEQANMLRLEGTPGFIIGNSQIFGGLTLDQLRKAVARARAARKKG